MDKNSQARWNFVRNVVDGQYTKQEAETELDRMEQEFGDTAFLPGTAQRKPRPWSMKDLNELEMEAISGAGSREFFSYMAEVSEEVYRKKRQRRKIAIFSGIAAVVALVAAIAMVEQFFNTWK